MATCDPETLMEDGKEFQGLSRRELEIAKNQLLCEIYSAGGGGGGISDAPSDGTTYGRNNAAWVAIPGGGDLISTNNLSDVANAATAFGNIKQAATTAVTGVVELATDGETAAGKVVQGNDSRLHTAVTLDANADTLLSLSTQELGLDTQTANYVFAGPTSGGAAVPAFRALVADDIPSLSATYALETSIGCPVAIVTESGTSRSLTLADIGKYIRLTNASSCTITVPVNASVDWASESYPPTIMFRVAAAGIPTISSSATINDTKGIIASLVTGDTFALQWVASDVWDVI